MKPTDIEPQLVKIFKDAKEAYVSGDLLGRKLGVSRSAIWKHMENLRNAGYVIEAVPHLGYHYKKSPESVLPEEIFYALHAKKLGKEILCYQSVGSTNRIAFDMAARGLKEGLVVLAETQTAGRGRLGRSWSSPKNKGIYMSVLLKPNMTLNEISKITLMAAVAVCEALEEMVGVHAKIKWPNDVLVRGKKICGILTEMNADSDQLQNVILGIGLNVKGKGSKNAPQAIALQEVVSELPHRNDMIAAVLNHLDYYYRELTAGRTEAMIASWKQKSAITGKEVKVKTVNEEVRGKALGIDADGALLIQQTNKQMRRILSGDVLLCR